ncbi:hypothetical protein OKA04_11840 [Luteolibacter flavescens]|uniref:Uncharacterized protein n=1 Tax=Luteolibacter flavescens TaxID=1859460 RepID=A0ABT3FPE2_9BACT|nr:hypothetical protein [Luteolibacter flavescens]MCW1885422.1 hypothetical protein [Luteolibacter flavescens]
MKASFLILVTYVGFAITAHAGRGDGGSPTAPPVIIGGGTVGGVDPEPAAPEWKAIVLSAYADGVLSRPERRVIVRFLAGIPKGERKSYFLSWVRLQSQIGRKANPAVVAGTVAAWAVSDSAGGADWLANQPGR